MQKNMKKINESFMNRKQLKSSGLKCLFSDFKLQCKKKFCQQHLVMQIKLTWKNILQQWWLNTK